MAVSAAAGLVGIALAYLMYVAKPRHGRFVRRRPSSGLYTLVYNKYFVDEIYDAAVVEAGGRRLAHGAVEGRRRRADRRHRERRRRARRAASAACCGLLQSGNIRSYATWVVLGFSVLADRGDRLRGRPAMNLLDTVILLCRWWRS